MELKNNRVYNLKEAVRASKFPMAADESKCTGEITINNKTISTNPVLNSDDLLVSKDYTVLGQNAENVFPGDIITTAIGKIEVMLANTTLALTAAINDLEMRIGKPSEYDEETGDVISEATGLYKKYEEIEGKLNSMIE